MERKPFPVIDPVATGQNIVRLRKAHGLTVRDLQAYFGFEEPQAIYKWQHGKSLPTVDNLYALGALLEVPMDQILVARRPGLKNHEGNTAGAGSLIYFLSPSLPAAQPRGLLPVTRSHTVNHAHGFRHISMPEEKFTLPLIHSRVHDSTLSLIR